MSIVSWIRWLCVNKRECQLEPLREWDSCNPLFMEPIVDIAVCRLLRRDTVAILIWAEFGMKGVREYAESIAREDWNNRVVRKMKLPGHAVWHTEPGYQA